MKVDLCQKEIIINSQTDDIHLDFSLTITKTKTEIEIGIHYIRK